MDMSEDCLLSPVNPKGECMDGRRGSMCAMWPCPMLLPMAPTTDGRALAKPMLLWDMAAPCGVCAMDARCSTAVCDE
jgi:hypothetical protein